MAENMPGVPNNPDRPLQFTGKPPPQFFNALKEIKNQQKEEAEIEKRKDPFADVQIEEVKAPVKQQPQLQQQPPKKPSTKVVQKRAAGSAKLQDLMGLLIEKGVQYDEIVLPSRGVFYDGKNGPANGVLHLREMVGQDEQILATPKYSRNGVVVDMIFKSCLKESFDTGNFLSIDRTYLLICIRSMSYGDNYEVDIKCPECGKRFPHTIHLKDIHINMCPENFAPPLTDTLEKSGFNFTWHLSTGKEDNLVSSYRETRIKEWGGEAADDSLMYRIALMLDEVEGLTNKTELKELLKKLPVQDIAYLKNLAIQTPFGLDTELPLTCAFCYRDFEAELPLGADFFFPRQRHKVQTQLDSIDS